jgi:hypothetical protein
VRQSCPCNPLPIGEGFLVGREPRRRRQWGAPERRTRRRTRAAHPSSGVGGARSRRHTCTTRR